MNRHPFLVQLDDITPAIRSGAVTKVFSSHVEATGPHTTVGEICEIETAAGMSGAPARVLAEVAAVAESHIVLVPLEQTSSIFPAARVIARANRHLASVGDAFKGRAINALAAPMDNGPVILAAEYRRLDGTVMSPLERRDANAILETGIRAIDGALTLARGQRIGIFAASGVGKTTLIRQMAAQVGCDHCILCLVGERGREVESLWRELAKSETGSKYTCVAATSDASPSLRARAVHQAVSLAEYWRDAGQHVVLIVDSVTRYAMALRELGLAAGAPPTLRAYTPNVFSALPRLVERCGAAKSGGAITAIITVLSETDDVDDPIVEVMKSLLDGHIVLSRQLAEQGQFPAIDLMRSVSRQSEQIMTATHAAGARRAIAALSTYEESRIMIESGLYKSGTNPRVDDAVRHRENVMSFFRQRSTERTPISETLRWMQASTGGARANV